MLAGCASSTSSPPGTTVSRPTLSVSSASPTRPASVSSSTAKPIPPTAAQRRARAAKQLAAVVADQPAGAVSVAALNTETGAEFFGGATSGMWTASVYKLFVLETLMLRGPLSSSEQSRATTMIENSDNVAGYSLFLAAGGRPALVSAARRFGMANTVPGYSDPTLTRTSGHDCLALLRNLVAPGPLSKAQRVFALDLMRSVERDQRWGVGVVADKGSSFANKNGWLSIDDNGPGESDDGLWAVTSLGVVALGGDQVLMAVLTRHQPDFDTGVRLVERLARIVAPTVRAAS
ncbi:MAG: serine hydrolase [bacterium]